MQKQSAEETAGEGEVLEEPTVPMSPDEAREVSLVGSKAASAPTATTPPVISTPDTASPVSASGITDADASVTAATESDADAPPAERRMPTLVWPPPDDELDDWHVIQLAPEPSVVPPPPFAPVPSKPASSKPMPSAPAPSASPSSPSASSTPSAPSSPSSTSTSIPRGRPVPTWLSNHQQRGRTPAPVVPLIPAPRSAPPPPDPTPLGNGSREKALDEDTMDLGAPPIAPGSVAAGRFQETQAPKPLEERSLEDTDRLGPPPPPPMQAAPSVTHTPPPAIVDAVRVDTRAEHARRPFSADEYADDPLAEHFAPSGATPPPFAPPEPPEPSRFDDTVRMVRPDFLPRPIAPGASDVPAPTISLAGPPPVRPAKPDVAPSWPEASPSVDAASLSPWMKSAAAPSGEELSGIGPATISLGAPTIPPSPPAVAVPSARETIPAAPTPPSPPSPFADTIIQRPTPVMPPPADEDADEPMTIYGHAPGGPLPKVPPFAPARIPNPPPVFASPAAGALKAHHGRTPVGAPVPPTATLPTALPATVPAPLVVQHPSAVALASTVSTPAPASTRSSAAQGTTLRRVAVIVLALLAVGQAAYIGARLILSPASAAPPAVLIVDSAPAAADVYIDGQKRGETPFRAELPAGSHVLELRKNGRTRSFPLTLTAGVQASQYVELNAGAGRSASPPSSGPGPEAGSSSPASGPAPAANPAGPTDSAAAAAAAGIAGSGGGSASTAPAATAPATPPTPRSGWVTIESPLTLSILRNGELLGNSDEGRLQLPVGRQELELVNDSVGYRATMAVQVPPGRETTLAVELPQSTLNITSNPSAIVWVDGQEVGSAPISQLALRVGPHEVRFRHPEFGERRITVVVRVGVTAQATVDFTK